MRLAICYCSFLCMLLITACVSTPASPQFYSPISPAQTQRPEANMVTDPPIPEAGKASIRGLLYSLTGKGPIPGTLYYFTPAKEQGAPPNILVGPRTENGDIRGTSDERGQIILNNITPGSYYLVVWAPYSWILAVESEVDMTPRLIILKPDQRVNLGVIYVPWP